MFDLMSFEPKAMSSTSWQSQSAKAANEAIHWGVAGSIYVIVKAGSRRLRGVDDWKNATIGGAAAGAAYSIMDPTSRNDFKKVLHGTVNGAFIAIGGEIVKKIVKSYS